MAALAEDEIVDMDNFEKLLDAKLNPITDTIKRLEKQQERIVELIANQATIMSNMNHLEDTVREKIVESDKMHDELFSRMRQVEKDSGDKVWDVLKIMAAGLLGGIVAWLAGNR